MFIVTLCRS